MAATDLQSPRWLVVPLEVLAGAASSVTREEALNAASEQVRRDKTPRVVVLCAHQVAPDPVPGLLVTDFALHAPEISP